MSTEDTTAQLRMIDLLANPEDEPLIRWTEGYTHHRSQLVRDMWQVIRNRQETIGRLAEELHRTRNVLAQVEAAKATARRDALLEAADDIDAADLGPFNQQAQWAANRLRARASAQGAAPPAECSCACHGPGGNDWTHTDPCCAAVLTPVRRTDESKTERHKKADVEAKEQRLEDQRLGGQGAQSSGHEYRDLAGDGQECIVHAEPKELCGKFRDDPIHQAPPPRGDRARVQPDRSGWWDAVGIPSLSGRHADRRPDVSGIRLARVRVHCPFCEHTTFQIDGTSEIAESKAVAGMDRHVEAEHSEEAGT